jgi:hypothetical protein
MAVQKTVSMNRAMVITVVFLLAALLSAGPATAQESLSSPDPSGSPPPAAPAAPFSEAATLAFDDPEWTALDPSRSPAAREDHTWTVDGESRFAYLFGGRDGAEAFADLWRFDLETDMWQRLSPRGKAPAPRFGHSAVWVDGHGVIVFAGQRGADFFDDLWVYDADANSWRELPAGGAIPKARYGSCLVVGSDGRLWISHGFTFAGRFDDTRAYNLKSERWASIAPDGRRPGERCLHDCFTSASGQLVLYGGQDNANPALGDLWLRRDDGSWRSLDDPKPKARRLYAVTEAGPGAWIFGGAGQDDSLLDDLWRVDRETLEFTRVSISGLVPTGRYGSTLITDTVRGRLLLFGGQGEAARADLWQLSDRSVEATDTADMVSPLETAADA